MSHQAAYLRPLLRDITAYQRMDEVGYFCQAQPGPNDLNLFVRDDSIWSLSLSMSHGCAINSYVKYCVQFTYIYNMYIRLIDFKSYIIHIYIMYVYIGFMGTPDPRATCFLAPSGKPLPGAERVQCC